MRFFIFLIFSSIIAKSQDIDTLLPKILALESDTEKVDFFYRSGAGFIKVDPQLAYDYSKRGEQLAIKLHDNKHLSEFYNLFGILYYKKGDLKTSIKYHQQSFQISKELKNILSMAYSATNMANIYSDLKQYKRSEDAYLQSLNIYNELGDKENLAKCLINLGVLKQTILQYDAAFENYKKAREIGKTINDYYVESLCLNNMGQLFADQGDFEKAIAYNINALKIRDLMENNEEKADTYLSLTEIYVKMKKIDEAEENLKSALEICDKYDYFSGKLLSYKLISDIAQLKGNYQLAYENLKKYTSLNDSLIIVEANSEDEFTFDDTISAYTNPESHSGLNNKLLLFTILLMLILIPFTLIKFNR